MKRWKERLVGIGAMYVWFCAICFWEPWFNSFETGRQVVSYFGMGLVTIAMIALFVFVDAKEKEVMAESKLAHQAQQDAAHWRAQAELARGARATTQQQ